MNRRNKHHETITTKCTMSTKGQLGFSLLFFVAIVAKNQVHGHNASQVICNEDFYNARRVLVRWLGLLVPGLLFLLGAVVLGAFVALFCWAMAHRIGAPTWNYHLMWPYATTFLVLFPAWMALVQALRPRTKMMSRPSELRTTY